MTIPSQYMSLSEFRSRSIMPSGDLDLLVYLTSPRRLADSLPLDASPEAAIGDVTDTGTVSAVMFTPDASVTANATNYAILSVYKRTDGGASTLVAQLATSGTSLVTNVPVAVPLVASTIIAGDKLSYSITKSGTGVLFPAGRVAVRPSVTFVDRRLAANSSRIDARLRKRYGTGGPLQPIFVAPIPEIVLDWIERLTTRDCYARRGWNPGSEQDALVMKRADDADVELKEAADSKDGLFDLPLRDDGDVSAVTKGGPHGYSEQSPYVGLDVQRKIAGREDGWGHGS